MLSPNDDDIALESRVLTLRSRKVEKQIDVHPSQAHLIVNNHTSNLRVLMSINRMLKCTTNFEFQSLK